MPSRAIIHEENFHKCMALNNIATLNSASFHELSSIHEICENFPSKITTHYTLLAISEYLQKSSALNYLINILYSIE